MNDLLLHIYTSHSIDNARFFSYQKDTSIKLTTTVRFYSNVLQLCLIVLEVHGNKIDVDDIGKLILNNKQFQLDIMRRNQSQTTQIHECAFEAKILHTNAAVKFSCKMFVAWKNSSNKTFCKTVNDNVTVQNSIATFNENLCFQTYMLFDKATQKYLKKQTSLCLFLISIRKPDEEKLVGRVMIDLSQVLNNNTFAQVQDHKLTFCSIKEASLTFSIAALSTVKMDMRPMDLDMDQFSNISKNLNQSLNSNNEDLQAFKSLSREVAQPQPEKNLTQSRKNQDYDANTSPQKIISPFKQGKAPKKERPEQTLQGFKPKQSSVLSKAQSGQSNQEKLMIQKDQKVEIKGDKQQLIESQQILQLRLRNRQFESQNDKLIEIMDQVNSKLIEERSEVQKWAKMYEQLKAHLQHVQTEKNNVIQELFNQVEILSHKHESAEPKPTTLHESNSQLEKLNLQLIRLAKQYQQSEKVRLDTEAEILEVRFELSELESERQVLEIELQAKDNKIEILSKRIQDMRADPILQQQSEAKLQKQIEEKVSELQKSVKKGEKVRQFLQRRIEDVASENEMRLGTKEQQIASLRSELQRKQQQYENELEKLKQQIQKQMSTNSEVNQLQQQISQLHAQLQTKVKQLQLVTNQLHSKQSQQTSTIEEFNKIKQQMYKVWVEKEQVAAELEKRQKYLQKLQHQLTKEQSNARNTKNENTLLKTKIEEFKSQITKLQKQNQSLKAKAASFSESTNKIQKLENILADKDKELEGKEKQTVQLIDNLKSQSTRVTQLEQRIGKFMEKESKMKENILILEIESKKIYNMMIEKEQNEEILSQTLEDKDLQIGSIRNQLHDKIQQLNTASYELAQLKKQLFEMRKQVVHSRSSPQSKQNEMEQAKEGENDARVMKLQQLLKLSNQRISEVENEVKSKLDEKNKQNESLIIKISKLKKDIENEKAKVVKLQQEEGQLRKQRIQLNQKLQIVSNDHLIRNTEADNQLNNRNNLIFQLQKQIDILKAEVKSKEDQLSRTLLNVSSKMEEKREDYEKKIKELGRQNEMMETQLTNQEQRISQLQCRLEEANNSKYALTIQLQQKEVEMKEMELQAKQMKSPKPKSQPNDIENSNCNILSKVSAEMIQACKNLQKLVKERSENDKNESIMELILSRNAILQQELNKITQQKGSIQQNARRLSMEFQKAKANILKGPFQNKTQFLSFLKPCELKVKNLVQMTQNLFESQTEIQNF